MSELERCDPFRENFTHLRTEVWGRRKKGSETGRCKTCGHAFFPDGDAHYLNAIEYAEHVLHAERLLTAERERVKRLEAALRLAAARFGSMSERMEEDGAENLQGWASECDAGGSEIHATLTEAEP